MARQGKRPPDHGLIEVAAPHENLPKYSAIAGQVQCPKYGCAAAENLSALYSATLVWPEALAAQRPKAKALIHAH